MTSGLSGTYLYAVQQEDAFESRGILECHAGFK